MKNKVCYSFLLFTFYSLLSAQTVSTHALLSGGITFDTFDNLYVTGSNQAFQLNAAGSILYTAGNGAALSVDGPLDTASFNGLMAIAYGTQSIYLTEANGGGNGKVRKVNNGIVTTLASGFDTAHGIAVDGSGNVYVADSNNHRIQKITPTGIVTTLAGTTTAGSIDGLGAAARFNGPLDLAVDAAGNVFVADGFNNKIRKITPAGLVTTYAGTGTQGNTDGDATAASFFRPWGLAIDATGNLYVADLGNNKIRKISPSGIVSTFAGTGLQVSTDGPVDTASFNSPFRLAFNSHGDLFVSEFNKIRKITFGPLSNPEFDSKKTIKMYPNPAHDEVTVEIHDLTEAYLELFNLNGQVLKKQMLTNDTKINIAELTKGVYIFKVTANEGTAVQKVIKY